MEVNVNGRNGFGSVSWAPDGKGLFVGTLQCELLYVDMEGRAEVLWQQRLPGRNVPWGIPSPDGRHLAILGYTWDSNVWMLEGF
jgi:hypothetical protein